MTTTTLGTPAALQGIAGRPAWSPDSSKVALERGREVIVVDRNDSNTESTIGPEGVWVANPSFSPDGDKIAYAAYSKPEGASVPDWGLYVARADGSDSRQISKNLGWKPSFNRDGDLIAFTGTDDEGRGYQMAVINADGSHERNVSPGGTFETDHSWDPTGQELVTHSAGEDGTHLWVTDTTGRKERQITFDPELPVFDLNPHWSPDGKTIVFERQFWGGGSDLYLVDPYGDETTELAALPGMQYDPVFSPDGKWIAFSSETNGDPGQVDLYLIRPDGTGLRRLTEQAGQEYRPSWSPDGRSLAYLCIDENHKHGYGILEVPADAR